MCMTTYVQPCSRDDTLTALQIVICILEVQLAWRTCGSCGRSAHAAQPYPVNSHTLATHNCATRHQNTHSCYKKSPNVSAAVCLHASHCCLHSALTASDLWRMQRHHSAWCALSCCSAQQQPGHTPCLLQWRLIQQGPFNTHWPEDMEYMPHQNMPHQNAWAICPIGRCLTDRLPTSDGHQTHRSSFCRQESRTEL